LRGLFRPIARGELGRFSDNEIGRVIGHLRRLDLIGCGRLRLHSCTECKLVAIDAGCCALPSASSFIDWLGPIWRYTHTVSAAT
jgi:hypothetical protein